MTTYEGSCHCGAVSFTFEGEIRKAMSCNCSYCRRLGILMAFGPANALSVKAEPDAIGHYTFNKNIIDHQFCVRCGIGTHGGGDSPQGKMAAVNLRCIPAIDLETLEIEKFNGAAL